MSNEDYIKAQNKETSANKQKPNDLLQSHEEEKTESQENAQRNSHGRSSEITLSKLEKRLENECLEKGMTAIENGLSPESAIACFNKVIGRIALRYPCESNIQPAEKEELKDEPQDTRANSSQNLMENVQEAQIISSEVEATSNNQESSIFLLKTTKPAIIRLIIVK